MKIKELKISNALCFPYKENINDCQAITFNDKLNIIIGTNGSGKTTVLEVINLIFRNVLFLHYNLHTSYLSKQNVTSSDYKGVVSYPAVNNPKKLRIVKNYNSETYNGAIKIKIELDNIDKSNIELLTNKNTELVNVSQKYTTEQNLQKISNLQNNILTITIPLDYNTATIIDSNNITSDNSTAFNYLKYYNYYKNLIILYNRDNPQNSINNLKDTFCMVGGYRNYQKFSEDISMQRSAEEQISEIKIQEQTKSLNDVDFNEPSIFNFVRLQLARISFEKDKESPEDEAVNFSNNCDLIQKINTKLSLIGLKAEIKMTDRYNWKYNFNFKDLRRNTNITDINSLSAGQKAIIHLIFEAYGRSEMGGGVVIIDEPELHLHYQYQYEYLKIIETLEKETKCQFILVTHSEALINSTTISSLIRLSLNDKKETVVHSSIVKEDEKWLVKILDNSRSTHVFFANKVLLVEGEHDKYFFTDFINQVFPEKRQEIAVLGVGGKDLFSHWEDIFKKYGLEIYKIADLDYVGKIYKDSGLSFKPKDGKEKLDKIKEYKESHEDLDNKIEEEYKNNLFILKEGDLEVLLGLEKKDLINVINYCRVNDFNCLPNEQLKEVDDIFRKHIFKDS